MDTHTLFTILDHNEYAYNMTNDAARTALESAGFDWKDTENNGDPDTYYRVMGDAVKDFLRQELENSPIERYGLLGLILGDVISDVDAYELGENYWEAVSQAPNQD